MNRGKRALADPLKGKVCQRCRVDLTPENTYLNPDGYPYHIWCKDCNTPETIIRKWTSRGELATNIRLKQLEKEISYLKEALERTKK
ncbi:MAG: hypothetical protein GY853_01700 [PVC group bacterium]|nr:hypothetical protein [PVC group bacterium]